MQRVIILLTVILAVFTACNDETGPSSRVGTHGWITGDSLDGYAVILHTEDGVNWTRQGSALTLPPTSLGSVSVVDSMAVWASGGLYEGYGIVVKTADGGENWLRMGSQFSLPEATLGIAAVDARTAWVTGENNTISRTTDGGVTWYDMSDPLFAGFSWSSIQLVTQSNIWVCGSEPGIAGRIIHSTDGGVSWREETDSLFNAGLYMITIKAWDENNAWAVGHGFTVARTTDGGDNWQIVTPDSLQNSMNDANGITLLSADDAWVVLDYGNIWRTDNGGDTWSYQTTGEGGFFLLRISALDASTAWVGGSSAFGSSEGIVLHTTDGGATWGKQNSGVSKGLWDVGFAGDMP